MKKSKLYDIAGIALMAAVICVCAFVTIPVIVPFTLQTFGVFLTLASLGAAKGTASVALYVLIGAVGVPVFSGFRGGIAVITGPTGGYITGFFLICFAYFIAEKMKARKAGQIVSLAVGLILCYALGTLWFYRVSVSGGEKAEIAHILAVCVLPFIIPDALKLATAVLVAGKIRKILPKTEKL